MDKVVVAAAEPAQSAMKRGMLEIFDMLSSLVWVSVCLSTTLASYMVGAAYRFALPCVLCGLPRATCLSKFFENTRDGGRLCPALSPRAFQKISDSSNSRSPLGDLVDARKNGCLEKFDHSSHFRSPEIFQTPATVEAENDGCLH